MPPTAPKPRPAEVRVNKKIKVYLDKQIVEAYADDKLIYSFDCCSGDRDHPTPTGRFLVKRKCKEHVSDIYNVPMDYAIFFTIHVAIHQYHGPWPVSWLRNQRLGGDDWIGSHGCVRLDESDARSLFEWTPLSTPIEVIKLTPKSK